MQIRKRRAFVVRDPKPLEITQKAQHTETTKKPKCLGAGQRMSLQEARVVCRVSSKIQTGPSVSLEPPPLKRTCVGLISIQPDLSTKTDNPYKNKSALTKQCIRAVVQENKLSWLTVIVPLVETLSGWSNGLLRGLQLPDSGTNAVLCVHQLQVHVLVNGFQ